MSNGQVPEYSVHLDAIRGVAASIVFLVHLKIFFVGSSHVKTAISQGTLSSPAAHTFAANSGRADYAHQAVIVFFVLSGFLVGGSVVRTIQRGLWSWRNYMIHRLVRLWMVLVPALLLGLLLDTIGIHHFAGQGTIYSAPPSQYMIAPNLPARVNQATFFGNLFFLQDILVPPLGTNQPLWSLANEFWYYAAFPLLALFILKKSSIWWRLLAICTMSVILRFVGPSIREYFLIWLLGVVAAVLPVMVPFRLRRLCALAALLLCATVNFRARYSGENSFHLDLLLGCTCFLLLYCVSQLQEQVGASPYRSAARFMSKISYSFYLTHGPVLCFMSALLIGSWRTLPLGGQAIIVLIKVVAAVLFVACSIHFLFEARTDRVRNYFERKFGSTAMSRIRREPSIAD
jgi:peptidoglycan/LPS O-acetylase OafA/YrhL